MTNQTRKYIWPVSLAMSLALVGVLVAFVAMAGPQTAQAHGPCNFDDGLDAFVRMRNCGRRRRAHPRWYAATAGHAGQPDG